MKFDYLDKNEYKDIPILRIANNKNGLPFSILKLHHCAKVKHRHEYIQIIYISKGKLKHAINNSLFNVYKGDIFVIPPLVPHYFIDDYGEEFEIIEFEFIPNFIHEKFSPDEMDNSFFDFAYLQPFLVTENKMKPRLNLSGNIQIETERIFTDILREDERREPDFKLIIKALTLQLLVLLGREFQKNIGSTGQEDLYNKHRDALHKVIMYINNNYDKNITIEEAARISMLSRTYFCYLF